MDRWNPHHSVRSDGRYCSLEGSWAYQAAPPVQTYQWALERIAAALAGRIVASAACHVEFDCTASAATGPAAAVAASSVAEQSAEVEIVAVEAPGAAALPAAVGDRAAADNFAVELDSEEWPWAA